MYPQLYQEACTHVHMYTSTYLHQLTACIPQTCTNSRNTSIPPGVLSFQVVFVDKFNLMEDISLLLRWPVSEGLDLISGRYM